MRNLSKLGKLATLVGVSIVALPLIASAAPLTNYNFTGSTPAAQITNIQTVPGHINNWPGAHNSNVRGQAQ